MLLYLPIHFHPTALLMVSRIYVLWHKIQVHLHFRFSLACKKNGDVTFPTSKFLHFQWCGAYTLGLSEIFNDRVLMKQQTKLHNMAAFPPPQTIYASSDHMLPPLLTSYL